jgi:hypothetical protein
MDHSKTLWTPAVLHRIAAWMSGSRMRTHLHRRRRAGRLLVMSLVALWPSDFSVRASARSAAMRPQQAEIMKIHIAVGGTHVTATLKDSVAAREFASLLPLSLTLADYNGTEKIADLPRTLSTRGAPEGIDPAVGDMAYYSPWGNLAIFYRDFGYSRGLVRLGTIDAGLEAFDRPGPVRVTMTRIDD